MAGKIEEQAEAIAQKLLSAQPENKIELVDVEYVKEREWYLRVFIDKEGGVDLEDCQDFSRRLEDALDEANIIATGYTLEVSSPGLDRVLKKERDFERERGKVVDVSLYAPLNGQKVITGVLDGADEKNVHLVGFAPLSREKIAQIRLHLDF